MFFLLGMIFFGCLPEANYIEIPIRRVNVTLKDNTAFKGIIRSVDNSFLYFSNINKSLTDSDTLIQISPDDGKTWVWRGSATETVDQRGRIVKNRNAAVENPSLIRISKFSISTINDEFGADISSEYLFFDPDFLAASHLKRIAEVQTKIYNIYITTAAVVTIGTVAILLTSKKE